MSSHDKLLFLSGSISRSSSVCYVFVIYAVLAQHLFCRDLRTFVWSKNELNILVCGAKMTNILYASSDKQTKSNQIFNNTF